jgi:2,4-dienoyl-CoA reductase-like NADH-dependent reductase (Old Yellow Enzyme family)
MSNLFSPVTIQSVILRNRIGVSSMAKIRRQWTLYRLASGSSWKPAVGGAGLVLDQSGLVKSAIP